MSFLVLLLTIGMAFSYNVTGKSSDERENVNTKLYFINGTTEDISSMIRDADCECKNGYCEADNEGKMVCKCPPEWGHYKKTECKKCYCGKRSNCTFNGSKKKCICEEGYKDVRGTCNECCKNGHCESDAEGNKFCKCPPEWSLYSDRECRKCDCGKGANCTFSFWDKTCICREGYKDVNRTCKGSCAKNPCKNGGNCSLKGNDIVCKCEPGFTGELCEKECCKNGNCEMDNKGEMFCKCPPEWGLSSDTECKKCECGEGANCTFSGSTKKCICKEGYKDIRGTCKECDCINGYCEADKDGEKVCKCPPEWGHYSKNECRECNCGKGANCTFSGVFFKTKKCICKEGYTEENKICKGSCAKNPCQNGGSCSLKGNDIVCKCEPGFTGEFCEKEDISSSTSEVAPSSTDPATTETEDIASSTSEEPPSSPDPFTPEPECSCVNGKCQFVGKEWACVCNPEYGLHNKGVCKACECGKGANCTFHVFLFETKKCLCPKGFKEYAGECVDEMLSSTTYEFTTKDPTTAEDEPLSSTPFVFTTRDPTTPEDKILMTTVHVFTTESTTTPEDLCRQNPCRNGGICQMEGNRIKCYCKSPYYGEFCENDPCSLNPCRNGGSCRIRNETFYCECHKPFHGTFCEKDPCTENPCQNGGICYVNRNTFACICKQPYVGIACELDPCSSNPCRNGGTCHIRNGTFYCECHKSFHGTFCEKDPCTENPCQNGGSCFVSRNTFICFCKQPYVGITCESDPCTWSPCQNDGICKIENSAVKCYCKEPFTGKSCETRNDSYSYRNVVVFSALLAVVVTLGSIVLCFICCSSRVSKSQS